MRLRNVSLAFVLVALGCATSASPPGAIGSWQADSGNGWLIVESQRLIWFDPSHNDLSVAKVLQHDGDLVTRHRGKSEHVRLVATGDHLSVTAGTTSQTYHRVDHVPDAMELAPLPIPAAMPLSHETVESIGAEIAARNAADQQLLKSKAPHEQIQSQEESNESWLRGTVARYGWIDLTRFGAKTSGAAIIMAKHSADTRLLLAAMPMMEHDLALDPKFAQTFAVACDQLLLSLGERQRYGSQVCSDPGAQPYLCAVEAPQQLDERRAAIGLPPIEDYLKLVSKMLFKDQLIRVPKN